MNKVKILLVVPFAWLMMFSIGNAQGDFKVWGDIKSRITAATFDDQNQYLFLATENNEIQMWDYNQAKLFKTFTGPKDNIYVITVSPNGKYLACGGQESVIFIWEIETDKIVNQIMTDSKIISALIFNENSTEIISGSFDNTIRRWDIADRKLINSLTTERRIVKIEFDPASKNIICGLSNGKIMILSSTLTTSIAEFISGTCLSTFDISKDGSKIVTASCDDGISSISCTRFSIKLWDTKSTKLISNLEYEGRPFESVVFSNCDEYLLSSNDSTVIWYNLDDNRVIEESQLKLEDNNISFLVISRDKSAIVGINLYGRILSFNLSSKELIKQIVERKINEWQKKGKFEKSEDYKNRVNVESRDAKIQGFVAETINEIASSQVKLNFSIAKNEYDADNEVFKIFFKGISPLYVKVPIGDAKAFDVAFNELIPIDEQYIFRDDNNFALVYLKIVNPKDNKEYIYDSRNELSFFTSNLQLNFEDIDIGIIPQNISNNVQESTRKIDIGKADIDVNLPLSNVSKTNAIAVIIGNREYQKTSTVSYAVNDAQSMKNYLMNVLGYKEGNIIYEENASKGIFEIIFGSKENTRGKLNNYIQPGISDVFIFYSGHGAPDLKNKKGYFVPIEADPNYIDISGYSLDLFYANISQLPAKSLTVVLDACFSGANVYENISPITITMDAPELVDPRIVVMSSSSGSEVSSWYEEKGHGLFTYYFLKAIHSKNADANGDNKLTVGEVYNYTTKANDGVIYQARRKGIEQNPTLIGNDVDRILVEW